MERVLRFILIFVLLSVVTAQESSIRVTELKTNYRTTPLSLGTHPYFYWQLKATNRDATDLNQLAYKVQVTEKTGVIAWDSGRVNTSQSVQIKYDGAPLKSATRYTWKVTVWDQRNVRSDSESSWFETGLSPSDWGGYWISMSNDVPKDDCAFYDKHPTPLLRKTFSIEKGKHVERAQMFVSGLGYYEMSINGQRVGDSILDPGWTSYNKRVLYSTYDIPKSIFGEVNAIGIVLGNGYYNPLPMKFFGGLNFRDYLVVGVPKAIVHLIITYTNGETEVIVSDESWKAFDGPTLRNNVYIGEVYDARLEIEGWNMPHFDDSKWLNVVRSNDTQPLGPLIAQSAPAIEETRILKSKHISEISTGVFIVDFGQNFAGQTTLRVAGNAGAQIRLRFGEVLFPNGTLNPFTAKAGGIDGDGGPCCPKLPFQEDYYIVKGKGVETYRQKFTWHVFRYVEITGFPGTPDLNTLTGHRLNSNVSPVSKFESSNPLLEDIITMYQWTQLSNMFSIQSDCPGRERFGYGGDLATSDEAGVMNFDMSNFYKKRIDDFIDAKRDNGFFTEIAPMAGIVTCGFGDESGPIDWQIAVSQASLLMYQYYGSKNLMESYYNDIKTFVDGTISAAKDDVITNALGDWNNIDPKLERKGWPPCTNGTTSYEGTAIYYYSLKLFARIAEITGNKGDAAFYSSKAFDVALSFNNRWLNKTTGVYRYGTQTCQVYALYTGIVPDESIDKVRQVLENNIKTKGSHYDTGMFGTKFLLNELTKFNPDIPYYDMVNTKEYPSWGYMLANGATTIWESWFLSEKQSHCHPMFGSVAAWIPQMIGGIRPSEHAIGFDDIIIQPHVFDLTSAKVTFESVRGTIISDWHLDKGSWHLRVDIPPNTRATIHLIDGNIVKTNSGVYEFHIQNTTLSLLK